MSKTTIVSGGITDGTIATADIANDAVTAAKASFSPGKIGQVVQDVKTDTFSTTSSASNPSAISGLSAAITPSATSSKILVMVNIGFVGQNGGHHMSFFLRRGSTNIHIGDAASNRPRATFGTGENGVSYVGKAQSMAFVDSPSSTSEQTYTVFVGGNDTAAIYINRSAQDADGQNEEGRFASSIILQEILA